MSGFARHDSSEHVRIRFAYPTSAAVAPSEAGWEDIHDPTRVHLTYETLKVPAPLSSTRGPSPTLPEDPGPYALPRGSRQRVLQQQVVVIPPVIITGAHQIDGSPIDTSQQLGIVVRDPAGSAFVAVARERNAQTIAASEGGSVVVSSDSGSKMSVRTTGNRGTVVVTRKRSAMPVKTDKE